ncbi:hypothetical protein [Microbacterium sp. H1-D42]|uniref:hypothetical protein n=1 Tax=Microbacterium sp. H1-D42 TaxID=2925844 RepID=UPI001F531849|nr:hypothetical protein [Microbacterium sp. H1-D42]UNK69404.1 hypothetical protein MNR00_09405 [Microbacterium sp. H1-D42]
MSLTSELRHAGSPIRAYLDGVSPVLAATRGSSSTARQAAATLGLVELAEKPLLVPAGDAVDRPLSGTAFDIRARIELGGFDPAASTSAAGVDALPRVAALVENGEHRAAVLSDAFRVGDELLRQPADASDLTRASVLFAYCEQVYRGGADALAGVLGAACDEVEDGLGLAQAIPDAALEDVEALLEAARPQIDVWSERIAAGTRFEPNPRFSGARLLGGADGDWMIGETLIDCKVYGGLSIAKLRDFLRQLLGYVMLDLEDALRIREVGVWLPRQQELKTWSLGQLLGDDPETLLPKLREGFVGATARNQIAVHVPVSERRKLQLLADNRHTPHAMLMALAAGDDIDLRFRVGRNASSPTDVVKQLATDHYARVREGVAMNTAAPAEVFQSLAGDSSVMVRRAVAANPSSGTASAQQRTQIAGRTDGAAPIESGNGEIVQLDERPAYEVDTRRVEINQDRDPEATPGVALGSILLAMLHESGGRALDSCLPEASRIWSWKSDRSLRLPTEASQGLPIEVIADLMSDQRTAYVRRIAARMLPIADTAVRRALFADDDPGIRWDALERSIGNPDPQLGEVLTELAGSREARIEFATGGLEPHERWQTPTEYSDQVARLIARHPATPSEALTDLVAEKSPEVLIALAGNPSLSAGSLESLTTKMASMRTEAAREMFAESDRTPVAVLEGLSTDRRNYLRAAVAANRSAPLHVLSRLAQDSSADVRLAVMANPQVPSELAFSIAEVLLASSENLDLHSVVIEVERRPDLAVSDGLMEAALDRLSKSRVRDPDLRHYAALDQRTGISTLERLAKSKDAEVKIAVSENPRTPRHVLEALALDADAEVRRAVACNDRLPQNLLNVLLLDDDLDVRIAAYREPDAEEQTDDEPTLSTEVNVAARPTVPTVTELQEMAANSRAEVRIRVAYSVHATPDILAFLGGERRSAKVRRAVAAHPKTPPEILRSLAARDDVDTLMSIAFNPGAPIDVMAELAGRSAELAVLVALNPDAPLEVLKALASDSDLFVRFVAEAQIQKRARSVQTTSESVLIASEDLLA